MRWLAVALLALPLAGCERDYNIYLSSRTSGATATAVAVTTPGHRNSGDISVLLSGKTYTGRWVYVAEGGAVAVSTATAFSGARTVTATGTTVAAPMQGNGSLIATSPDGASLHCGFNFSGWSRTGTGACQDSAGEIYDLQITGR
ncbi:MAG TPA: hypothetical protein VMQ73_13915 [Methylomirabilota bacterium]|nr:hypothetical protein [Methylomirabilota bacterium]